jgi:hypothetical protein
MKNTSNKIKKIAGWLDHLCDAGYEDLPATYRHFESQWKSFCGTEYPGSNNATEAFWEVVQGFHADYPQYVRFARMHWALLSLFTGRGWRRDPKKVKVIRAGSLPRSLNSLERPFLEDPDPLLAGTASWAAVNQAIEGEALGVVGPFGAPKDEIAVCGVFEMFRRFPFKEPCGEESLDEPCRRTASYFQASQISSAVADTALPDDTYEFAVAAGILDDCRESEVLVLSDIGDMPLNSASAAVILDILDFRRLNRLPTVWTTQFNSAEIEKRLGFKFGKMIIQRLSHRAKIVKL